MSPTETLKEAARLLREEAMPAPRGFARAVKTRPTVDAVVALPLADLLEAAADKWGDTDPRFLGRGAHIDGPLSIARDYLAAVA